MAAEEAEESGIESEPEHEEEVDFDDSNDQTFRPSAEDRLSSSVRRARPSDSVVSRARPSQTRAGRARPSEAERSGRGEPSPTATAASRGQRKSVGRKDMTVSRGTLRRFFSLPLNDFLRFLVIGAALLLIHFPQCENI